MMFAGNSKARISFAGVNPALHVMVMRFLLSLKGKGWNLKLPNDGTFTAL
jgi:hypothetical protein